MLLLFFLLGLLSTAYLTLYERHLLAATQHRLGPNKVFLVGLIQPFADALKLFQKELVFPLKSDRVYYFISPTFMFGLWFLYWVVNIPAYPFLSMCNSGVFFMVLVGSNVYIIFFLGYCSKSKFAHLGALRTTVQSLTFELSFFFLVLAYFFVVQDFEFSCGGSLLHLPMAYLWLMFLVVELGRAPVDFPESESETVSGYNVEYGGVFFIFIFLSEYGMLLFFSSLFSQLFFSFLGVFGLYVVLTFIILLRSALPRLRYDQFMKVFWCILLPVSMQVLLFYYLLMKVLLF